MPDVLSDLREALARIERSPQRIRGGVGGQTMEATAKATIREISEWDLEAVYQAADWIEQRMSEKTDAE